ncbi:MAG TPA: PEPxxWA-CTERM sorting domain-containing protein, partial [Caulobacteraceae bacterium]|nr:PEPxxWA-CTERM sorting domain-containing protein [Caulobacteraceae bacterium]
YGTVAVTDDADPNVLHILVTLADNVYFNQAGGGLDAFFFDLVGNPTITISGLSSQFGTNGSQAAGSHHEDGLGDWDYIITWLGPPNDNSTLGVQTLSFDITGLSALTLDSTFSHDQDIFFGADIYSAGFTGLVGAPGGGGAVPEPATWALLIFGIGLTGVVLRRRRAGKAAFA